MPVDKATMDVTEQQHFLDPINVFQDRRLPVTAKPAGYAALIKAYDLQVPLPRKLCAIGEQHKFLESDGWSIRSPRYEPNASLEGHLTFALKYEGLDLAVLKKLFAVTGPDPVVRLIQSKPSGTYFRRIWFLYEWLMGTRVDLPDTNKGAYVFAVDPQKQFSIPGRRSPRHRVVNNLPGTPAFCPLVYRTASLNSWIDSHFRSQFQDILKILPRELVTRAAAYISLKDSRASFTIEGEHSNNIRIRQWSRAISQAGSQPLERNEFLRLQRIVIDDDRFISMGFRREGGFVGLHDQTTREPVPDHVSARPEDLPGLMEGLVAFEQKVARQLDPVVAAAVLSFGFVYIHPFEDGNGRVHRYLMHHILVRSGFNPPGIVIPVSAVILEAIDEYRDALEDYAQRLLPVVRWEPTAKGNVRVLNDTGDFYRFFDATPQTEFLYRCIERTITKELPKETNFLKNHDMFRKQLAQVINMPERLSDLLFRFLDQNEGRLSNRSKRKEFAELTADEVSKIESIYYDIFIGEKPKAVESFRS